MRISSSFLTRAHFLNTLT
uniref:Uncharacterized protein n=1 Tax=Rhizophora mucronata TaxID=61149 RepID=A0A2P2LJQ1_RHIMU